MVSNLPQNCICRRKFLDIIEIGKEFTMPTGCGSNAYNFGLSGRLGTDLKV